MGDPSVSTDISGSGTGIPTPRPSALRRVAGSEQDARVVSPSEGNEVRREGRTGVGAPRSTVETGEPFRGTRRRERSEANCLTSGCKSRRRRSPCGAVVIPGSPRGDPRIGSPEVKAPGGQVGSEPLRSGQHRGQATRRAAAKANGLIAEIGSPHEADLGGAIGDAKIFFSLIDGQRRCGRMGQCPHRISRRKLKAAILESQAAKARKVWKPDRRILECQRPFL